MINALKMKNRNYKSKGGLYFVKRKKIISIIIGSLLCLAIMAPFIPVQSAQGAEVTLEVLNPKGNIEPMNLQRLAERIDTLDGKKIELWFYSKDTASGGIPGCNVRDAIRYWLEIDYPTATILSSWTKSGVAYHESLTNYEQPARNADAVILGVAN
jgi:hypothetical protein